MEVHKYDGGVYNIMGGYPKLITEYLGDVGPQQVTACAPDHIAEKMYLFNGDLVYKYAFANYEDYYWMFKFIASFNITDTGKVNPFR